MTAPDQLNALRAFEASARHESFSAAAAELHVTPAAVGQLVRTLERTLGTPLFHRATSGRTRLVPTEAARRALPDLRAGFDRLGLAVARLKEGAPGGVLTVTVSPAFAAKWLLPRIERFQAAFPDTDVRLDVSIEMLDFAARGIDIGVRYGAGVWPGLIAQKLMDEEIYPVCSPVLLRPNRRLRRPSDLAGVRLIHDLSVDARSGFATWSAWLARAGADVDARRGLRINNSAAVLQAAIDGQGVALARSPMARDDLAAGRLVRLFPEIELASALAYYIVHRSEPAASAKLVAFRDWLLREAR
jgi:LysR family transcriptional regulator, glycine cleavage system transcriptional activator